MRWRILSPIKWLAIIFVLIISFLPINAHRNKKLIADLEASIDYKGSVDYRLNEEDTPLLPWINELFTGILDKIDFNPLGDNTSLVGKTGTRIRNFHHYLQLAVCRNISEITIDLEHGFDIKKFGIGLDKVSKTQTIIISDNFYDAVSEDAWKHICTQLRKQSELISLHLLFGSELTDHAISPLQNHPSITTIDVTPSKLTPESALTFSTLPNLKELNILITDRVFTEQANLLVAALQERLPSVTVKVSF